MRYTSLVVACIMAFTVGGIASPVEEEPQYKPKPRKKPPPPHEDVGKCVIDSGNGVCVILDGGYYKSIKCGDRLRKCTEMAHNCRWEGGFANCGKW